MKIRTAGINVRDLQTPPRVSEACDALVTVEKVKKKDGAILLILCIITATLAGQIGRGHVEYLNLPIDGGETAEELSKRILCFLQAFGLIDAASIDADEGVDFNPEQFVGRRAIVQFMCRKNQPLQIPFFGVWATDDPNAPFVPSLKEKVEVANE